MRGIGREADRDANGRVSQKILVNQTKILKLPGGVNVYRD